ncbi:MAG TPA: hypothetical protein VJU18_10100 [Vicinamibacteria bacterium]|nr:hypothetical protein [Vicinamibacteria bacterium]
MQYPVDLSFKLISLGPQIAATDATGRLVFFVKQKAFRLKEQVTVFADREQSRPLYTIAADRILDFSARYHFRDAGGASLGSIKRQGLRSLWRSRYDVLEGETVVADIREENPWIKVADGVFEAIPLLGMLSGYLFHPSFLVSRADGTVLLRLTKRPAFFEGRFQVERVSDMGEAEENRALLSVLMMLLIERGKG